MPDAQIQQKKKQLMIVGVIVVAGVLFFLRIVFWQKEFKESLVKNKPVSSDTLQKFNSQWQEIRNSIETKLNEQKTAPAKESPAIDAQTLEILKKNLEVKTKTTE